MTAITRMADDGAPLMTRVLGEAPPEIWEHYPADDAVDGKTGCRWFYHTHAPGERDPGEHGHFHLFVHRSAIAPGVAPLAFPTKRDPARADLVHIAGLSIDTAGVPKAWFATNRWVTDETLYPAEAVMGALQRFDVRDSGDTLVGEFLTAMVALCRRELALLLRERDRRLLRFRSRMSFERGRAVLSCRAIDVDQAINRDAIGKL